MPDTVYRSVSSLDEAASLLADVGPDAAVLSGGQSLIAMISAGLASPSMLIDINNADGVDHIALESGELTIGACVRHRTLEAAEAAIDAAAPTLRPAAGLISHLAVRNRGTLVGSLAHADPAAEWPAVTLAADATIHLVSATSARAVPAAEFFLGPMTTAREPDEVIARVRLPAAPPNTYAAVSELSYRDGDYAVVGVVAQLTLDARRIADARIVLFGVDATPIRDTRSRDPPRRRWDRGAGRRRIRRTRDADPSDDATASRTYRLDMIPVFLRRAVQLTLRKAESGQH